MGPNTQKAMRAANSCSSSELLSVLDRVGAEETAPMAAISLPITWRSAPAWQPRLAPRETAAPGFGPFSGRPPTSVGDERPFGL